MKKKPSSRSCLAAVRGLIRGIDAGLRRKKGIYEYSTHPGCMFRVGVGGPAADSFVPAGLASKDGKLLELHLWGDRVPPMPFNGPDLAYAKKLTRMTRDSLRMLADYLVQDPRVADVAVIGGITNIFFSENIQAGEKIFSRLGMRLVAHPSSAGAVGRFFTDLYGWMLMWTYNPQILRARKPLQIEWYAFWISKADLVARYATETPIPISSNQPVQTEPLTAQR